MEELPEEIYLEILKLTDPSSAVHFAFASKLSLSLFHKAKLSLLSLAFALERKRSLKAFRHLTSEPRDDPFLLYSPAYIRAVAVFGHLTYLKECPRPWSFSFRSVLAHAIKNGHLSLIAECLKLDRKECEALLYKNYCAYNKDANLRFHIELLRFLPFFAELNYPLQSFLEVSDPLGLLRSIIESATANMDVLLKINELVAYASDKSLMELYVNSEVFEGFMVSSPLYIFAECGRHDLIEYTIELTMPFLGDYYDSDDFQSLPLRDILGTALSFAQYETFHSISKLFPDYEFNANEGLERSINLGNIELAKTYDQDPRITNLRLQDSALAPARYKNPDLIVAMLDWLRSRGLDYPSLPKALNYSAPLEVIVFLCNKLIEADGLKVGAAEDDYLHVVNFEVWESATFYGRVDVLQYFLARFGDGPLRKLGTPISLIIKGCLRTNSYREARWILRTFNPTLTVEFCAELAQKHNVTIKYNTANTNIQPYWITFFSKFSAPILESKALSICRSIHNKVIESEIRQVYGLKAD